MGKEIAKLAECTDKQRAFIQALKSPEIVNIASKDRFRWAADKAEYSNTTSISEIMAPLRHLVKDIAEQMLSDASIYAAWQVTDTLTGGEVDSSTKVRLEAAKEILDRSVPKRAEAKRTNEPITIVIMPAKQEIIEVSQYIEHEN